MELMFEPTLLLTSLIFVTILLVVLLHFDRKTEAQLLSEPDEKEDIQIPEWKRGVIIFPDCYKNQNK